MWLCLPAFWRVCWCECAGFRGLSPPFVPCSLLLSALSLFPWCVACEYTFISRFKGVFSVFLWLRVGLYCLRALRGLCGFCVRVELGGYMTCGVFRLSFCPFCPAFMLFTLLLSFCSSVYLSLAFALLWLSFACPLVLSLVLVFSFSLTDYTQKERAQFLASSLRLLSLQQYFIYLSFVYVSRFLVCKRIILPISDDDVVHQFNIK